MLNALKKVDNVCYNIVKYISSFFVAVIVLLVFAMVVWRYVLNNSIVWAEEFLRYLDMWMILIGAGLTARLDQHVCIDVIQGVLEGKPKIRTIHYIITRLIVIAFLIYLIPFSIQYIEKSTVAAAIALPWLKMSMVYSAFPIGAISMIYGYLHAMPIRIKQIKEEGEAYKAKKAAKAAEKAAKAAGNKTDETVKEVTE